MCRHMDSAKFHIKSTSILISQDEYPDNVIGADHSCKLLKGALCVPRKCKQALLHACHSLLLNKSLIDDNKQRKE